MSYFVKRKKGNKPYEIRRYQKATPFAPGRKRYVTKVATEAEAIEVVRLVNAIYAGK